MAVWSSIAYAGPAIAAAHLSAAVLDVAVALTVLLPLLPGVHPRMASHRAGPGQHGGVGAPGLVAINYGDSAWAPGAVAVGRCRRNLYLAKYTGGDCVVR